MGSSAGNKVLNLGHNGDVKSLQHSLQYQRSRINNLMNISHERMTNYSTWTKAGNRSYKQKQQE